MAVTITRVADVDDDLSGHTGTVRNNAWKTAIYDQIDTALAQLLPLAGATDVFLVAGQSNAQGQGVSATSIPVPTGKVLQYYSGSITDANDPVGNANTGSAWPAFGVTYYQATGRKILFVPTAVAGTAQVAAADTGNGNWDAAGALYGASVTTLNAALAAATAAGHEPRFCGVLWGQGETDADGINASTVGVSQATYTAALIAMIARYRSTYGAEMPFYIFATGTKVGGNDAGYSQVRAAQRNVCAADPALTSIVFEEAIDFPGRSLMNADNYHYLQPGYIEMGRIGASAVVSGPALSFASQAVSPLFDAAMFTADVGNWTLTSPDVTTLKYAIVGKMMTVWFVLDTTTLSSTPTVLRIKIPADRTSATAGRMVFTYWYNNGSWVVGYGFVAAGATVISLQKDPPATAFAAGTNTVYLYGSVTFPIA